MSLSDGRRAGSTSLKEPGLHTCSVTLVGDLGQVLLLLDCFHQSHEEAGHMDLGGAATLRILWSQSLGKSFNGDRVSVVQDRKVLERDDGDNCATT